MTTEPRPPRPGDEDRSVGELVIDVSERVSFLVREEIELAKTEVTEKVTRLARGSVVGIVAGVFAVLGFAMLMHAFAWLLNELFFEDDIWLGFLIEAIIWFVIAAIAGFFAYSSMKAGAPPAPAMAIEEAKEIRETLEAGHRWLTVPSSSRGRRRRRAGRSAPRPGPAARSRSATTSCASARSSVARSRPCAAASASSRTGAARSASTSASSSIGAAVVGFAVGGFMALRRR